jgi:hypothetical protein
VGVPLKPIDCPRVDRGQRSMMTLTARFIAGRLFSLGLSLAPANDPPNKLTSGLPRGSRFMEGLKKREPRSGCRLGPLG